MFTYRVNEDMVLRLPDANDTNALFTLFEQNRAHLTEWQDWPNKIQTLDDCRDFILEQQREYLENKGLGCLIVFQDVIVGMCSLAKIVLLLRKAEIEYWIAADYQGRGIVTQACRGMLQHAYANLKLNRVALKFKHVSPEHENWRSRKVAERLGFTVEGTLRQDGMTKGVLMDMVMCSLLADEWRENQS